MKIFKLISLLLDYPETEIGDDRAAIFEVIQADEDISAETKVEMIDFVEQRASMDLLDWQSDYDALFERGRNLSLLLFEHVHGESRDRGQAMVDLMEQYKQAGLDIGAKELPDYLPLFLEFLSTQDREDARAWLQDVSHILATLQSRLEQRDEGYASLLAALLEISQAELDLNEIRENIAKEERDDTNEAIDKVWEEEMVTFSGGPDQTNCPSSVSRPSEQQSRVNEMPVNIINPAQAAPMNNQAR